MLQTTLTQHERCVIAVRAQRDPYEITMHVLEAQFEGREIAVNVM